MSTVISAMSEFPRTYRHESLVVRIHSRVWKIWNDMRQLNPSDGERFGVLVGSHSGDRGCIWLEDLTQPLEADKSARFSFRLQDPGHQRFVDRSFNESDGQLGYVGTWHTHPEKDPVPSKIDLEDWQRCMARNPDRGLVFAIVGIDQVALFAEHSGKIKRIKMDDF